MAGSKQAVDRVDTPFAGRITPEEKVELVRQLLVRRFRIRRVETIETHFAWVFLTPRLAFKLKKALRRPAMDYRGLAGRRWGCEQELWLNRRMAPRVYLSIVRLVRTPGGKLRLGGAGQVEDYLLKMRRLSRRQMLDRVVSQGLTGGQLERLVGALAAFFDGAAQRPMAGSAYLRRLGAQIEHNHQALRSLRALDPRTVGQVYRAQLRFLRCAGPWLAARAARLVDGHGDLRAEHVHLGKSVQVIDCLEFDRELRRLDPMQELAQLALEISYLGNAALGRRLLQRYCERTGETIGAAELWFYWSHDATTRAKLAAWHIGDPQFPDPRPWVRRAERYLRQALSAIRSAQRTLSARSPRVAAGTLVAEPPHRLRLQGRPVL